MRLDRGGRADEPAVERMPGCARQRVRCHLDFGQRLHGRAGLLEEGFAGGRQADPARVTLEQLHAELRLELRNRL